MRTALHVPRTRGVYDMPQLVSAYRLVGKTVANRFSMVKPEENHPPKRWIRNYSSFFCAAKKASNSISLDMEQSPVGQITRKK